MPRRGPTVICTVDVVLLTLVDDRLQVVLVERGSEPFRGAWALPSGEVDPSRDASTWESAARVLRTCTAITGPFLEQLATWSGTQRDPRGWSMSVAYYALVPFEQLSSPLSAMRLASVNRLGPLAFDHAAIIAEAVDRIRAKSHYSSLPVHLCGEQFSLTELQHVFEAVLGEPVNKVSFRRKIGELGVLEAVPGGTTRAAHRPAQLYRVRREFRRRLAVSDRGINARA